MSTRNWWLGTPGAMQLLPQVTNNSVTAPRGRARQVTVTAGGGSVVVAELHTKTQFSLAWAYLTDADADLVDSFNDGMFGDGPFILVNPLRRNLFGQDNSTMGLRTNAPIDWLPTGGSVITRVGSGPQNLPTGVLQWSGTAAGLILNLPINDRSPVCVPGEATTASLYLRADTATSVSLHLAGYTTTGTLTAYLPVTVPVVTGWQRFAVTAAPGYFPTNTAFLQPRLTTTGSSTLYVAAGQVEYGQLSDWQRGYGSPRVIIAENPGHSVEQLGYADKTLVLAEC